MLSHERVELQRVARAARKRRGAHRAPAPMAMGSFHTRRRPARGGRPGERPGRRGRGNRRMAAGHLAGKSQAAIAPNAPCGIRLKPLDKAAALTDSRPHG
jgi:hypothetical protein